MEQAEITELTEEVLGPSYFRLFRYFRLFYLLFPDSFAQSLNQATQDWDSGRAVQGAVAINHRTNW